MNAEIIAIGSELLTPYKQDTNSLFLTSRLNELGVQVKFKNVVGDDREHLTDVARVALSRSQVIIFMGGLGPTEDDLTRECVATALGVNLKRDMDIVAELYARFAQRRVKMPENNARQADVIDGAVVMRNPKGSAPGQWIEGLHMGEHRVIILLPGPPFELEHMFDTECMPRLRNVVPPAKIATMVLKCALLSESMADERAAPIYKQHQDVETTILAGAGQVEFHLRAVADTKEEAQARVEKLASELEDEFEDAIFSTSGESLEQIVGYYLQMRNATLAVAESCTGGLLAQRISNISGSSRYFLGGAIVYSNDLKTLFCDVPPLMIAEHGAVSKQVALALAEGIRKKCRSTIGVGVTGIAGPTGGSDEKPVGLVYIGLASQGYTEVVERKFPSGDRERIRMWAAQQALDMIRKKLI